MKDYLLEHDGRFIECELDGLKLIYTCSCDQKCHYEEILRDCESYVKLKNKVQEIYESHENTSDGYWDVCEYLQSYDADEFFTNNVRMMHRDLRDIDEICAYEKEAFDKVWLMRTRPCDNPDIEERRLAAVDRIFNTYADIPERGYDDWECGYWNGIMGALRWVMGDEKNFLDT